jgi:endogenous inhibitor of DNA gyrase (YacG/DUF329 family)
MSKEVKCPHCGNKTKYDTSNPNRPFCSERCQLIDFGAWATGKYAIAADDKQNETDKVRNEENPNPEED